MPSHNTPDDEQRLDVREKLRQLAHALLGSGAQGGQDRRKWRIRLYAEDGPDVLDLTLEEAAGPLLKGPACG